MSHKKSNEALRPSLCELQELTRRGEETGTGTAHLSCRGENLSKARELDGNHYLPVATGTTANDNDDDEKVAHVDGSGSCGQRLSSLSLFVFAYSLVCVWTTAMSPMLGSQITSIERHLGIRSSTAGLIMSGNELGYLAAVMVGSHVGKYAHIPRCLGVSQIVFGLACIVISLGKFMEPRVWQDNAAQAVNDTEDKMTKYLCDVTAHNLTANNTEMTSVSPLASSDKGASDSLPWGFWLLAGGALVEGMSKSYRIPLLTHYVETNSPDKNRSALLLGFIFTAMVFGPPIALLLGGFISSLPVDLGETALTEHDPRWVGAWWLGFVIIGLTSALFSLPILFFPRHIITRRRPSVGIWDEGESKTGLFQIMKDLPKSLFRIFRRPIYMMALLWGCVESFAFSGWISFSQKYAEIQFNMTPQKVSLVVGVMTFFSLAAGTCSGGVISSKLKLGLRGCVLYLVVVSIVSLGVDSLNLVVGCSNSHPVGEVVSSLPVSVGCACDQDDILLVCGDNNVDYLSPCWAGCTNVTGQRFLNCSEVGGGEGGVTPGLCTLDCDSVFPYMALHFVGSLIGCSCITPGFLLTVRSVEHRDKSLASGTAAFCQTLLGYLPSPIVFGQLVDMTCRLWHPGGGNCVLYDRDSLRLLFNGFSIGPRAANLVLVLLLLLLVQRKSRRGELEEGHDSDAET